MKFKIKVNSPSESVKIQEKLFEFGFSWFSSGQIPCCFGARFIFINMVTKNLTYSDSYSSYFDSIYTLPSEFFLDKKISKQDKLHFIKKMKEIINDNHHNS